MAWLTVGEIRQKFNIQSNAFESQIESAIGSAARRIQKWVNSTVYTEAINLTPPVGEAELLRYETVRDSHAFLTMYYLAISVGSKLSDSGFVKQAQANSSAATQQVHMNQYLEPDKIAANKQTYYDEAREIIEDYLTTETVVEETVPQNYSRVVPVVIKW